MRPKRSDPGSLEHILEGGEILVAVRRLALYHKGPMSSRSVKTCLLISAVGFLGSFVPMIAVLANDQDGPKIVVDAIEQCPSPIKNSSEPSIDNGTIGKIETARSRNGRAVHLHMRRRGQPVFRQNAASTDRIPTRPGISAGMSVNRCAGVTYRNRNVTRMQTPQEFGRMRRQIGSPAIRLRNVPAAGNVQFDQLIVWINHLGAIGFA